MAPLDHLVPSSPWPSRRWAWRSALGCTVVVVLALAARAAPPVNVDQLLGRRPRLGYVAGKWPESPGEVRTLKIRALPLDLASFGTLATRFGYRKFEATSDGFRAEGDRTRLVASRSADVWQLVYFAPRPAGAPADLAAGALARAGLTGWRAVPGGSRPGVFVAVPPTELPVATGMGQLAAQVEVTTTRLRFFLTLVAFEPGSPVSVGDSEEAASGSLRRMLLPEHGPTVAVHDVRLVLDLPRGAIVRDGAELVPMWAFDTRLPAYGVLLAPAAD